MLYMYQMRRRKRRCQACQVRHQNDVEVPASHCSSFVLLQKVMRDPVLCGADGHSYERTAIQAWLAEHGASPLTQTPASLQSLIANHALRSTIERLLAQKPPG